MSSDNNFMYSQPSTTNPQKTQLNNEQLQSLLNKLSSDEQKDLAETMKNCTTEVTMTRGMPITAVILGSLYFSRQKLPQQYHFGPKGWPFYAIMGIASLTTTNLLFMGTCRDRVQPKIDKLWQKYQTSNPSKNSYDEIRRQNRGGDSTLSSDSSYLKQHQEQPSGDSERPQTFNYSSIPPNAPYDPYGSYKPAGESNDFDMVGDSQSYKTRRSPPSSSFMDDSSYMSGTPSGPKKSEYFS